MISCASKYRKIVRKNLRCLGNTRKEILKRFDNSLSAFLEDNPNATEEDLFVAFGPALEMSDVLMESVPQAEIENYHKQKKTKKIIRTLIVIVCIILIIWLFLWMQKPIVIVDEVSQIA